MNATALLAGARAALPFTPGIAVAGALVGSLALRTGLSGLEAAAMSVFVFAGPAQIAALEAIESGAGVVALVAIGLVINSRYLAYGAAIAPSLGESSPRERGVLAYLLTDTAFAVSAGELDEMEPAQRTRFVIGAGVAVWVAWQLGTAVGVWVGAPDPAPAVLAISIPLLIMGLVVPRLASTPERLGALAAAGVAVFLPGIPAIWLVAAVTGTAVGLTAGAMR